MDYDEFQAEVARRITGTASQLKPRNSLNLPAAGAPFTERHAAFMVTLARDGGAFNDFCDDEGKRTVEEAQRLAEFIPQQIVRDEEFLARGGAEALVMGAIRQQQQRGGEWSDGINEKVAAAVAKVQAKGVEMGPDESLCDFAGRVAEAAEEDEARPRHGEGMGRGKTRGAAAAAPEPFGGNVHIFDLTSEEGDERLRRYVETRSHNERVRAAFHAALEVLGVPPSGEPARRYIAALLEMQSIWLRSAATSGRFTADELRNFQHQIAQAARRCLEDDIAELRRRGRLGG